MYKLKFLISFRNLRNCIILFLLFFSVPVYASFIESTMGAAVVNDATATYYNPSALTLLKNSQLVALASVANFQSQFNGQSIQTATGFTQSGSSNLNSHYYYPAVYLAIPTKINITTGLAIIANEFNNDIGEQSILRYIQSNNQIQDIDLIPAVGFKLNKYISIGAGLNFSRAHFLMQPISGLPSLNIPDSQSRNNSSGTSVGGDIGILLTPKISTMIGLNYRSAMTYQFSGTSSFNGITANNYHFTYWTPARSVFSIIHFITPQLGLIGTIQYIQWSIFNNINIYNIAAQIGLHPGILPNAKARYHFHNAWIITLGNQYRISPLWIIRIAGSYIQSPANPNYQIANGDSLVLGASLGYQISKKILIDGSYAHAFFKNQNVHITTGPFIITGVNKSSGDSVSVKLTFNV